ncbi:MAG: protein-(glutamine-N5) methyltransferase, release factor-specific [Desulfobulbaceae bacterium A2]|nr:MAG: protein-(glutamine-N5) methyltransferase, release factor-specific [Desulfobulbaceae bacterium A2]
MCLHDVLQQTTARLRHVGVEEAELEARLLMEHALGLNHSGLILAARRTLLPDELSRVSLLLEKRLQRVPLSYLTGTREFWSLDFLVDPAVLIPRPETEFLLECVLAEQQLLPETGQVLDLCCGSGVIAVVLARELVGKRRIVGVDLSFAALRLARCNAERHGAAPRIDWLCADLCGALSPSTRYALVVTNPPYIASNTLITLAPEVRDHEPLLALDGGEDGLAVIRRLLRQVGPALLPGALLFCEIGAEQGEAVLALAGSLFPDANFFDQLDVLQDWAGRPRVLRARRCLEGIN